MRAAEAWADPEVAATKVVATRVAATKVAATKAVATWVASTAGAKRVGMTEAVKEAAEQGAPADSEVAAARAEMASPKPACISNQAKRERIGRSPFSPTQQV